MADTKVVETCSDFREPSPATGLLPLVNGSLDRLNFVSLSISSSSPLVSSPSLERRAIPRQGSVHYTDIRACTAPRTSHRQSLPWLRLSIDRTGFFFLLFSFSSLPRPWFRGFPWIRRGGRREEGEREEERRRRWTTRDATSSRFASCQPRSVVTRHGKKTFNREPRRGRP